MCIIRFQIGECHSVTFFSPLSALALAMHGRLFLGMKTSSQTKPVGYFMMRNQSHIFLKQRSQSVNGIGWYDATSSYVDSEKSVSGALYFASVSYFDWQKLFAIRHITVDRNHREICDFDPPLYSGWQKVSANRNMILKQNITLPK